MRTLFIGATAVALTIVPGAPAQADSPHTPNTSAGRPPDNAERESACWRGCSRPHGPRRLHHQWGGSLSEAASWFAGDILLIARLKRRAAAQPRSPRAAPSSFTKPPPNREDRWLEHYRGGTLISASAFRQRGDHGGEFRIEEGAPRRPAARTTRRNSAGVARSPLMTACRPSERSVAGLPRTLRQMQSRSRKHRNPV
jgi:hypothetical protein